MRTTFIALLFGLSSLGCDDDVGSRTDAGSMSDAGRDTDGSTDDASIDGGRDFPDAATLDGAVLDGAVPLPTPGRCDEGLPVGVPAPGWGRLTSHLDAAGSNYEFAAETRPYPDAGDGPYTHYVDNNAAAATDTDNPFGTPARPRQTVPGALSAGSIVEVHGGPYASGGAGPRDRIQIDAEGTAEAPVFIRGPSIGPRPVFTQRFQLRGQYLVLENLHLQDNTGFSVRFYNGRTAHHVAVRSNEIEGTGVAMGNGAGIGISGTEAAPIEHFVIVNNEIHHLGDADFATENDYHGIVFGAYVTNAWVLGNHVHHNGGDSLQASHNARFTTSHLYIGCNHFHDDRENAIDIKQANDVIITQNDLHGYEAVDSSAGAVVVIHNGPSRVCVLFNHVWDGVAGVVSTGSDDLFIVGNLIRNIRKTPGDTRERGL